MSIITTLHRWLTSDVFSFASRPSAAPPAPPPPVELDPLPPGIASDAVRVTTFHNRSLRTSGENDYTEWDDRLISIVDKNGCEHVINFGPDDWLEIKPGLWYRNATATTEIVVALEQLPVVLRARESYWSGDQDHHMDHSYDKFREIVFSG